MVSITRFIEAALALSLFIGPVLYQTLTPVFAGTAFWATPVFLAILIGALLAWVTLTQYPPVKTGTLWKVGFFTFTLYYGILLLISLIYPQIPKNTVASILIWLLCAALVVVKLGFSGHKPVI